MNAATEVLGVGHREQVLSRILGKDQIA